MNWSDFLGANPSDGGMRKDTTPEKKSISWENLYVTPYQYSSDDYGDSRYSVVSDSGPRDGKVAANAVINIWNGTVSMAQTVAERRVIQSVTNTVQGVYKYFKTTPASKVIDDLMNEEYADEALSFGFMASLGMARFGVKPPVVRGLRRVGSLLESIDDVMANPSLLKGKSPLYVEGILGKTAGWRIERLGKGSQKGNGWVLRQYNAKGNPTGSQIRWHPGGGHHGSGPYWRVVGPQGDLGGIIR